MCYVRCQTFRATHVYSVIVSCNCDFIHFPLSNFVFTAVFVLSTTICVLTISVLAKLVVLAYSKTIAPTTHITMPLLKINSLRKYYQIMEPSLFYRSLPFTETDISFIIIFNLPFNPSSFLLLSSLSTIIYQK